MTAEEFPEWRREHEAGYAAEKEKEGLSPEDAAAESKASFERLLGQGLSSPGHHLYMVEDQGAVIGCLWWGPMKQGNGSIPWIYDISLVPGARGKGLGRQVMEWAEKDVRAKGFDRLGLHVFGHNKIARRLYESLGFETRNVVMQKKL